MLKKTAHAVYVPQALNFRFDITAISESKLKGNPQIDINLPGYHSPHCKFTEAEKGGAILYIRWPREVNRVSYTIEF